MVENNDLMILFRQFKLGECLFRSQYKISDDMLQYSDYLDIAKRHMIEDFCSYVINHHQSAIQNIPETENGILKFDKNRSNTTKIELLVLKMEDLKTFVETAIQMLPDDKIRDIKAGHVIL